MARMSVVLALLVALVAQGAVMAQRPSDLLGNLPPAGELAVAHYFPEHSDKQFPAGDVITVVVSGRNTGSKPMNLSAVVGSINSPEKFDMYIQNFTVARYFAPLAPGAEASIEYKFRADPILGATPPREWAVALHVLYEVSGEYFSSTFFNQTVEFAERPRLVDTDLLWLAATLLALAGAGVYFGWKTVADRLGIKTKGARAPRRDAGAAAAAAPLDEDEWVKGTHYEVQKRRRAAAARKA